MDQIPIFIELARANSSTDFVDGKSKFIRKSIIDLLQRTHGDSSGMEEQIDELFSLRNDKPEFFLLLDGFNEVARDDIEGELRTTILSREIRYIIKNYSNVRVILTSRTKEIDGQISIEDYVFSLNPIFRISRPDLIEVHP